MRDMKKIINRLEKELKENREFAKEQREEYFENVDGMGYEDRRVEWGAIEYTDGRINAYEKIIKALKGEN